MGLTALIIPTPGQTEQEYLAEYLSEKGWFRTISQDKLASGISMKPGSSEIPEELNSQSRALLTVALNELLDRCHKQN